MNREKNKTNMRIGLRVTAHNDRGKKQQNNKNFIISRYLAVFKEIRLLLFFYFSILGDRNYNEDTFSIVYEKDPTGKYMEFAYIGMFDG